MKNCITETLYKKFHLDSIIFKVHPTPTELEEFLKEIVESPFIKITEKKKYSLLGILEKKE